MIKVSRPSTAWLDRFLEKQTRLTDQTNDVYLTSGGYYQTSYVAIFEDLTSSIEDDHAKFMANTLNVDVIADLFLKELLIKYPDRKLPFNKILSVTLPSQMIAKEIQDKLEHNNMHFEFFEGLEGGVELYGSKVPSLIRLASYYSFADEIQFKSVVPGDRILIVNDVISTGRLLDQIYDNINRAGRQYGVNAKISCVLAVVDSRVRLEEKDAEMYHPSKYFKYSDFDEANIISLKAIKIYKYKQNPFPEKNLIRINPILNSRITMDSKHSELDKIAYQKADEFLAFLPENCLKIGHFAQNSLHHNFFITPGDLFAKKPKGKNMGIALIKNVVDKIAEIEDENDLSFSIRTINKQFETIDRIVKEVDQTDAEEFATLRDELTEKLGQLEATTISKLNGKRKTRKNKQDDFVFFPVFSGIEMLNKIDIQEIFKVDYSNIIPLQRFDTNKGWRFIIPQQSYNQRLKGASATVIDMGSFTGESIIQMIDALCVFELKKITVISLVGRLEDFDREFFSRIHQMKIKLLDSKSVPVNGEANKLAPVKIYFGVNLQIPASLSSKVCELCQEINLLSKQKEEEVFKQTPAINYINRRLIDLEVSHVANINAQCPSYFPVCWDGSFDVRTFYSIRNHLGKIDGYRFYSDYYSFFDKLDSIEKDYKKNIESILAICLHENHLLKTISNQLPDVKQKISDYLDEIICGRLDMNDLCYKWEVLSILEGYFLINQSKEDYVFGIEPLKLVFDFIIYNTGEDNSCFHYLAYKFAENYHDHRQAAEGSIQFAQTPLMNSIKKIWEEIEGKKSLRYHSLITQFNRKIVNEELMGGKEVVKCFFSLFKMYDTASAYHPNHDDFSTAINNLKTAINKVDMFEFKKELEEAQKQLIQIQENLAKVETYISSLTRLFKVNSFASEYTTGEKSIKNYLIRLHKVLKDRSNMAIKFDRLWDIVKELEHDYFALSDGNNFYNLWKSSNYITVLDIWKCFKDITYANQTVIFTKFLKQKGYADRIKDELEKFEVSPTKSYKDIGVNLHPYLMIFVFKELLDNSLRYAKKSQIKISLTTEINPDSKIKYTIIRYRQNKIATGDPANGLKDVEKILSDFNGLWEFKKRRSSLLIKIGIPVTQYKLQRL